MTHDYKRHGTTTLFAALNMATGEVIGKTYRKHRHRELLRFLREVEKTVPKDQERLPLPHCMMFGVQCYRKYRHFSPILGARDRDLFVYTTFFRPSIAATSGFSDFAHGVPRRRERRFALYCNCDRQPQVEGNDGILSRDNRIFDERVSGSRGGCYGQRSSLSTSGGHAVSRDGAGLRRLQPHRGLASHNRALRHHCKGTHRGQIATAAASEDVSFRRGRGE